MRSWHDLLRSYKVIGDDDRYWILPSPESSPRYGILVHERFAYISKQNWYHSKAAGRDWSVSP